MTNKIQVDEISSVFKFLSKKLKPQARSNIKKQSPLIGLVQNSGIFETDIGEKTAHNMTILVKFARPGSIIRLLPQKSNGTSIKKYAVVFSKCFCRNQINRWKGWALNKRICVERKKMPLNSPGRVSGKISLRFRYFWLKLTNSREVVLH